MKKTIAVLLVVISVFTFASCSGKTDECLIVGDSNVAEVFASYPNPEEIYDKVKDKLEDFKFDTGGLTMVTDGDTVKYCNDKNEVIYEVTEGGNCVSYNTVDTDNNPVVIQRYYFEDEPYMGTETSAIGPDYKVNGVNEVTIYGKDKEMIYYTREGSAWRIEEAMYYDEKGLELYSFNGLALFAEQSESETVCLDKVLTDDSVIAVECKIGQHKFTVTEENDSHVLYLTACFYAVFQDKQSAEDFAVKNKGTLEEWRYGYYTVSFENSALRLTANCQNIDYIPPESGNFYWRTVVLNEQGKIVDFHFDGPVLLEKD